MDELIVTQERSVSQQTLSDSPWRDAFPFGAFLSVDEYPGSKGRPADLLKTDLLNAAKVMSSSQVELPNAAEAEQRGK